jgi:hypothetical protein
MHSEVIDPDAVQELFGRRCELESCRQGYDTAERAIRQE